jgi:alcohol dehydrogenase class IV
MAHGVAAALGVHAKVPHGLACAVMLPVALRTNRDVALPQLAQAGRAMKQAIVGSALSDSETRTIAQDANVEHNDEAADLAIQIVRSLCHRIGIPTTLTQLGVSVKQLPAIVASSRGNSMNGNPKTLTDEELTVLLREMTGSDFEQADV